MAPQKRRPQDSGVHMAVQGFSNDDKITSVWALHAATSRATTSGDETPAARSAKMLITAPLLCLAAACGSASGAPSDAPQGAANASATTGLNALTTSASSTAPQLGTNVATIQNWDGSRPFMNLIYGSDWQMQGPSGAQDLPAQYLDSNGWVKSLPAGYQVLRGLSFTAASGDIICRYQGNGTVFVGGNMVSNISYGSGFTKFTLTASYPNTQLTYLKYDVDPTNYIRNIDCREVSASTTDHFAPEFTTTLNGFKLIRFMKWSSAEGNSGVQSAFPTPTITWATRNKPGDGSYVGNDGVPVEEMVALANQMGADAWFSMPWNADDDYITKFATYVRDNLAPGRQVYVETSNEVWNAGYPVYHQAAAEGLAENLDGSMGGEFQRAAERYGEKTSHVMQIWSNVFSGQMNRLVRVYAFQTVNIGYGEMGLKYAIPYVDAYATAPYWAFFDNEYAGQSLDEIMNTVLPGKISEALTNAAQSKALAQKYNLRFVTYEGGQHVVLRNNPTLLTQIERDSRIGNLYTSYINQWQSQIGDTLTLFALTGPISPYGAWGMTEYNGQPSTQTPKMNAVRALLGTTTASTQICPDGSVISSTSTCPTTTTQVCPDGSVIPSTSTCPTATTSRGLRKGSKKGVAIA